MGRGKLSEVLFKNVRHLWKIASKDRDRLRVKIDRCNTTKSGSLQAERESSAAAEEIKECALFW